MSTSEVDEVLRTRSTSDVSEGDSRMPRHAAAPRICMACTRTVVRARAGEGGGWGEGEGGVGQEGGGVEVLLRQLSVSVESSRLQAKEQNVLLEERIIGVEEHARETQDLCARLLEEMVS